MDAISGEDYNPYEFVYILSAIFGAIAIIGPILVPRGPDRDLYRLSILEAAFFMWLAWVTIYCGQIYPSEPLTFQKEKIVFISYMWGNVKGVKPMEIPTTTTIKTTTTKKITTRTPGTTRTTISRTMPSSTTTTLYIEPYRPTIIRTTKLITTTELTTTISALTTTTTRPFYYRTYVEGWKRKQYYWVHNNYFDFSLKSKGRAHIYLTLSDRPAEVDRTIEVIVSNKTAKCEEYIGTGKINLLEVPALDLISEEEYRRFYVDIRSASFVKFGRYREKPIITCYRRRYVYFWGGYYILRYVSFTTVYGEGDWLIHGGPWFSQIGHYGGLRRHMHHDTTKVALRSSSTQVVTSPAYVEAKPNYKFIPIIGEPIEFGVMVERQIYREFFVLLSPTSKRVDSSILIHIGSHQGRTCSITKNWEVMKLVKCKLAWYHHFYLQFWVYYKNGTISVKAGYSTPDPYPAFISWTDPQPSPHKYYGLRTVVGTQIPMSVIEVVHPEELSCKSQLSPFCLL